MYNSNKCNYIKTNRLAMVGRAEEALLIIMCICVLLSLLLVLSLLASLSLSLLLLLLLAEGHLARLPHAVLVHDLRGILYHIL